MYTASLIERTGTLVAAYVSRNALPAAELPTLIDSIHAALAHLSAAATGEPPAMRSTPGQIAASIGREYLVSFIDGQTYKTLKRHLTAHGLHPQSYRERYGLPPDYPMVAEEYRERRSTLSRAIGLGVPGGRTDQRRAGTGG